MADIHITRHHSLGLPDARKLAFRWAEEAEEQLEMECIYEEGEASDRLTFTRSGAKGTLKVTKDRFVLDARLGLLIGAFRHRIEKAIVDNLDELLAHESPLHAFEQVVARRSASRKAGARKKA